MFTRGFDKSYFCAKPSRSPKQRNIVCLLEVLILIKKLYYNVNKLLARKNVNEKIAQLLMTLHLPTISKTSL